MGDHQELMSFSAKKSFRKGQTLPKAFSERKDLGFFLFKNIFF